MFLSKEDETFSFFTKDCDVDKEVVFEAGLYTLGVKSPGEGFEIGAAGFFVGFIMFLISLLGVLLVAILLVVGFVLT